MIITHNPITMARMNRLFGVTMAERGVSQLVSVDLEAAVEIREASAAIAAIPSKCPGADRGRFLGFKACSGLAIAAAMLPPSHRRRRP